MDRPRRPDRGGAAGDLPDGVAPTALDGLLAPHVHEDEPRLLVPTFIVGLYGQNFRKIPELPLGLRLRGSWGLIIVTPAAQVVYFRRKKWI